MYKREPLVLYRNLRKNPTRQSLYRNKNAAVSETGNGGICVFLENLILPLWAVCLPLTF